MCCLLLGHFGLSASGQGLFANVSEAAGVNADGLHHAVAIGDFDRDGREDIYVGTKFAPNRLFRNLGGMEFEEVAVPLESRMTARPTRCFGQTSTTTAGWT